MQREPVKPRSRKPASDGRSSRSSRWAAHREQRRAELVEAALEAIREHGAGASVATIAAAAGVTKPVLYRHFADRADLQRAVSERAARLLLERLLPELVKERPPVEHIRSIVEAFLAAAHEEPQLWHFVVHNPGGAPEPAQVVEHNMAMIANLLASAIGDRLRLRGLDAGGAEVFAYGLVGMVYTTGDWWLNRRTMGREALTDYLTSIIWSGLSGVLGTANQPEDLQRPLRLVAGVEGVEPARSDSSTSSTEKPT